MNLATNLMAHFVQQAAMQPRQYHNGSTSGVLALFEGTDEKLTSNEVADRIDITRPSAASILRTLYLAGQLGREEYKFPNAGLAYRYYKTTSTAKCSYCGELLTGSRRRFCSQKCNGKYHRIKGAA